MRKLYDAGTWITRRRLKEEITGVNQETLEDELRALFDEGLVAKSRGHTGRFSITEVGIQTWLDNHDDADTYEGSGRESDLYPMLEEALRERASAQAREFTAVVGNLKMRRGQWSNPDLIQVSSCHRRFLGGREVQVSSYEVKTWKDWSVKGVFEAAAHGAVFHRVWLVLEWAPKLRWDAARFERYTARMMTECGRLNVGLMTLHPGEKGFRLRTHLRAKLGNPDEQLTESVLAYYLKKLKREHEFEELLGETRAEADAWEEEGYNED